jgi:hypothetical protein
VASAYYGYCKASVEGFIYVTGNLSLLKKRRIRMSCRKNIANDTDQNADLSCHIRFDNTSIASAKMTRLLKSIYLFNISDIVFKFA